MSEAHANRQQAQEVPRYQLTEKAYIDDVFLDPETRPYDEETGERKPLFINFAGKPGPHMRPVNNAAREMVKKYPPPDMNVVEQLAI